MDAAFIEAIAGIIEANEYFIRFIADEMVRYNIKVANLLYWNKNDEHD
jgi:hypothetical protein